MNTKARKEILSLLMVLVCAVAIYCVGLGSYGIIDPGEAYYAEAAREMCESQDFITPHLNYQIYFSKPIFTFWAMASAYRLFGVSEFACRIPFAILTVLLILAVYALARKIANLRTALFVSLITSTAPLMVAMVKLSPIDLAFTVFLDLCLMAVPCATFLGLTGYWPWIYVFLALAILTKGPVTFILLFFGGLLFALAERASWDVWRQRLQRLRILPGALIVMAIVIPWYAAISIATHGLFLKVFFLYENLARFAGHTNLAHTSTLRYLPTVVYGFFPWVLYIIPASVFVWNMQRQLSRDEVSSQTVAKLQSNQVILLMLSFSISTFLFFSFSHTQLDTYILPIIAPLSLVVGYYLSIVSRQWRNGKTPLWARGVMLFIAISGLLSAAFCAVLTFSREMNSDRLVSGSVAILGILFIVGYAAYAILCIKKRYASSLYSLMATNALISTVSVQMAFHVMDAKEMRDLRTICALANHSGDSVAIFRTFKPSMMFYAKKPIDSFFHGTQLIQNSDNTLAQHKQLVIVSTKNEPEITSLPKVHMRLEKRCGNWFLYETDASLEHVESLEKIFNNQTAFEKSLRGEGDWGPLTVPYAAGDPHWWQHKVN